MKGDVIWILIISFLDLFAVSLIVPLMSVRLTELGLSHFLKGCLTSIYALTQLISGPIVGSWSDRIGRQKIFVFVLIAVSCCYTLFGLFDSLFLVLVLRALLGAFKHTQVLIRAVVTDRVPFEEQTLVFGHLRAVSCVSFMLGPAIGGNLVEYENGFIYVCYCVGTCFLLCSALVYLFLNDVEPSSGRSTSTKVKKNNNSKNAITQAIRDLTDVDWSIFWDVFALKFFLDFSVGAFHSNYNLKLKEKFDAAANISGYTISVQNLGAFLVGIFGDFFSHRYYSKDVFYKRRNIHAYTLIGFAFFMMATTKNFTIFVICSILLKAVYIFLRLVLTEMTIKRCPPGKYGSIFGASNSMSSIARLITPILCGFVEDQSGLNSSNFLGVISAIFGTLISMKLNQGHEKIN